MNDAVRFSGSVLTCDRPNKNKHLYTKPLLERLVAELQDDVANRSLLGQIGFPDSGSAISATDVSHVVTALWMEGDEVMAEIETLPTPQGLVLKTILGGESKYALRTMGVGDGEVNESGVLVIGESFKLTSISVVPAADAA